MSVLTVIKKIGDKVISIVEWPFKHAAMLDAVIADGLTVAVGKAHCGKTARCGDCPLAVDLQYVRSNI
jgi:hypothetical protein